MIWIATIVAPTGVPAKIEARMPATAQTTDTTDAQIVTEKKLRQTRIADRAGNTTSAEISSDPTRFIARTITTAIRTAMRK